MNTIYIMDKLLFFFQRNFRRLSKETNSWFSSNKRNCGVRSCDCGHANTMAENCLARMCVDVGRLYCVPSTLPPQCRHLPIDNCSEGVVGLSLG